MGHSNWQVSKSDCTESVFKPCTVCSYKAHAKAVCTSSRISSKRCLYHADVAQQLQNGESARSSVWMALQGGLLTYRVLDEVRPVKVASQPPYCSGIRHSNGSWNWNGFGWGWCREGRRRGNWQHGAFGCGWMLWGLSFELQIWWYVCVYALQMTCTERMPYGTEGAMLLVQGMPLLWCSRCS